MIIASFLLLFLGIAVIYSSDPILAVQQAIFGMIGILFYVSLKYFDYRSLKSLLVYLYFIIVGLLITTLVIGFESRGSIRWIPIGPFTFQPSEFAKPVLILVLSYFWSKNQPTWLNIIKSFLISLPFFFLIFRQPDLGTTLTVFFIWVIMLIASHISVQRLSILAGSALIALPFTWYFLQSYQRERIISFLSPTQDPQGIGFHVIQSMIAVGSGEFVGRGLGRGTQSRLQFLPEFRTDFIFAFIAEELGFVGSVLVIFLYSVVVFFCLRALFKVSDRFGELIIYGVSAMLFFQITINMGMNMGLLPITGITLPLLSYGGSSVITTLICLGLVASVSTYGSRYKQVDTVSL